MIIVSPYLDRTGHKKPTVRILYDCHATGVHLLGMQTPRHIRDVFSYTSALPWSTSHSSFPERSYDVIIYINDDFRDRFVATLEEHFVEGFNRIGRGISESR